MRAAFVMLVVVLVLSVCIGSLMAQQNAGIRTAEVVISPNGRYMAELQIVAGVPGQRIEVIDVDRLTVIGQVQVEPGGLASTTISMADDGETVAYVARGGGLDVVTLVKVFTGEEKRARGGWPFGISWLHISPEGSLIVFPGGFAAIIETLSSIPEFSYPLNVDNRVVSASWGSTDTRLAVVTSPIRPDFFDGATAHIFNLDFEGNELTPTVEFTIQPAGGMVAWSPDATRIAVARDHGFDLYESSSGILLMQVEVPMAQQRTVGPLAWSHDGAKIAGGVEDGVAVWDVTTGEEIAHYPGHYPMALAWRSDGSLLQVGHRTFLDDNEITLGDAQGAPPTIPIDTPTPG